MQIKNKGQALVEFVLILPILIMILFLIIDISKIYNKKSHLEIVLTDASNMLDNGYTIDNINSLYQKDGIYLTIEQEGNRNVLIVKEKIDFVSPISSGIFNMKQIESKRVLLNE